MDKTAVMISIRPEWCKLIAEGKKTIEIRKTKPILKPPFKCYIYCTRNRNAVDLLVVHTANGRTIHNANQMVIGEFVCREITNIEVMDDGIVRNYIYSHINDSCVPYDDIVNYIGNGITGYGWRISDLAIYDQPLSISEFSTLRSTPNWSCVESLKRPPQSWCYVFERKEDAG